MRPTIRVIFLLLGLSLIATGSAFAQTASVKDGNVFFVAKDNTSRQLTFSGLDSEPSLSFGGDQVVFVRRTPDLKIDTGVPGPGRDFYQIDNELWIVSTMGAAPPRRILRGHAGTFTIGPQLVLAGFSSPHFSLDGKLVFFEAATWATDAAIYSVDVASGSPKMLYVGVGFEVIRIGKYKGYLIGFKNIPEAPTHAHAYWLLDPDGKLLHQIGDGSDYALSEFKKQNRSGG
jgi:hypothetical protein